MVSHSFLSLSLSLSLSTVKEHMQMSSPLLSSLFVAKATTDPLVPINGFTLLPGLLLCNCISTLSREKEDYEANSTHRQRKGQGPRVKLPKTQRQVTDTSRIRKKEEEGEGSKANCPCKLFSPSVVDCIHFFLSTGQEEVV